MGVIGVTPTLREDFKAVTVHNIRLEESAADKLVMSKQSMKSLR
jgi:hypothetical protein